MMQHMGSKTYDYIVVGAGIEGSATAYHLAKNGHKTLLIEQFQRYHNKGSSHGSSRITRKAYNEDLYAKMMLEAYPLWEQLAQEANEQLFVNCGGLFLGPKRFPMVSKYRNVMDKYNMRYSILKGRQIQEKFPIFQNIPDDWSALYDPEAGLLMADKCLRAFQTQFVKNGGEFHEEEKLIDVLPYSDYVEIRTNKAAYQCKSVVLCLGAWSGKFIKDKLQCNLPLEPKAITICYWQETVPDLHSATNNAPAVVLVVDADEIYFSLPSLEYRGLVKLCYDTGPLIDPDRKVNEGTKESVDKARSCLERFYVGLANEPTIVQQCLYTYTVDHHLILDRHPSYKNVIIGAGFSGHGFKLSPTVGKILSSLAVGQKVDNYDMQQVGIARFAEIAKKPNSEFTHHML